MYAASSSGWVLAAVAPLVGGHRVPAPLGQRVEVVGEVLLGAGEAVHQEQRASAGAGLGHGERDGAAEAGDLDGALVHDVAPRSRRARPGPR